MELSQTALGMLLLGGFLIGAAFSILYVICDVSWLPENCCKQALIQIKDLVFVLFAGIVSILYVYYVNDGEFRYLVLFGMVGGYILTQALLARSVLHVRNAVLRVLCAPLEIIWSLTFGRLCARVRMTMQIKSTEHKGRELELLASNGF